MNILSIDVGIKNLAVCHFYVDLQQKTHKIIGWYVFDLCKSTEKHCSEKNKNGSKCNKRAKYIKNDVYCCKIHANTSKYFIPTLEMSMKNLKKKRVSELYTLAKNYSLKHEEKVTKAELLNIFEDHIREQYFKPIIPVKIDDIHMINIGRNIADIFNEYFSDVTLDIVLIENQISPIANKMKTVQGMISQYFIMTSICEIIFVSSINKLKDFDGCSKLTYKERKSKSISICEEHLSDVKFKEIFEKSSKKDDLADSYLQGLWYIRNKVLI
jgi:hypothetical protein